MKLKIATLGLVAGGVFAATQAFAQDTQDLNVNATVNATCKFQGSAKTVTIQNDGNGAIDPSLNTDATGTATVKYRCTKGTTPSAVTAGDGQNFSGGSRRVAFSGEFMPYSLTLGSTTAGSGHGTGQDKDLSVSATITAANHQNASAGTYTDVVVLTITP